MVVCLLRSQQISCRLDGKPPITPLLTLQGQRAGPHFHDQDGILDLRFDTLRSLFLKMGTITLVCHSTGTVLGLHLTLKTAQQSPEPSASQGKPHPYLAPCSCGGLLNYPRNVCWFHFTVLFSHMTCTFCQAVNQ